MNRSSAIILHVRHHRRAAQQIDNRLLAMCWLGLVSAAVS